MNIYVISGLSDIETFGNQSMKNTIKYLSEFGYRISVFTFFPNDKNRLQDPKKIFNSDVRFYRLPAVLTPLLYLGKNFSDAFGGNGREAGRGDKSAQRQEYSVVQRIFYIAFLFLFYLPFEFLRVSFCLFREKSDLFYGLNYQGAVVASLLARVYNRPVVTRFYGASDIGEKELSTIKDRLLCLDVICGMKSYSDAIIMTDDGTQGDKKLKFLNVDEDKIHFWMNGLDTDDLILPEKWEPDRFKERLGLKGKRIIIMVSRLAKWKRVDRGIRCLNILISEFKMRDVALLIIGDGPEKRGLEELAHGLGVRGSVFFLGGVPHKEIYKYFSISDVFLSLYDISNLGNPLLEALYSSVPIVTLNDNSTNYLLNDGYNALLVDKDDAGYKVAQKVKSLLDEEALREAIGRNAKKTFSEKVLSWKERMRLEDDLIKKIASNKEL